MTAASKDRFGKQQKVENIRPTNPGNQIRNEELTLAGIHRRFHATNPRSRQSHPRKADVPDSTFSRTDFKSYLLRRICLETEVKAAQPPSRNTQRGVKTNQVRDKSERVRNSQQRSRQTRNRHETIQPSAPVPACCGDLVLSGHTY